MKYIKGKSYYISKMIALYYKINSFSTFTCYSHAELGDFYKISFLSMIIKSLWDFYIKDGEKTFILSCWLSENVSLHIDVRIFMYFSYYFCRFLVSFLLINLYLFNITQESRFSDYCDRKIFVKNYRLKFC